MEVEEEKSVTEALEAAFDAVEGEEEAQDANDQQSTEPEPDNTVDSGGAAASTDEPETGEVSTAVEATDKPEELDGTVEPESEAPSNFSPAAREAWKDVPEAFKKEVLKREAEVSEGFQRNAADAKRARGMDQTLAPYQQFLQLNGGPGQTIKGLLDTGASLQMGSPQQKAQTAANLITMFGVDISMLDGLLSGQGAAQETSDVQTAVNQAIAPYQQMLEQQRVQQQQVAQAQQANTSNELQSFESSHEFYKDVRADMADILDMASNRGLNLSLEEAYDRACRINPEINNILQARESAKNIPDKRAAASSISGNLGGPGSAGAAPTNMEDQLNAAWDAVARQ